MRYSCFYCGSIYSERVDFCTVCFSDKTVLHLPEKDSKKTYFDRKERRGAVAIAELRKSSISKLVNGFEAFGRLPSIWKMMVYGKPGSGKSTFSLKFASAYGRRVLFVAVEEGLSESLKEKIFSWELVGDVFISDAQSRREMNMDIEEVRPSLLVIDSISASQDNLIDSSIEVAQIWVCHSLKSGDYKGESSLGHVVDLIVRVEEGKAKIEKNRFGKIGEEIQIL